MQTLSKYEKQFQEHSTQILPKRKLINLSEHLFMKLQYDF